MGDLDELADLPADGPTDGPLIKAWVKLPDAADDELLEEIAEAVNSQVRCWRVAQAAVGQPDWPQRIVRGATMLGARLYRRRNSPSGVEAFSSEGVVYVQRVDPDVAQLLQLGPYQPITLG